MVSLLSYLTVYQNGTGSVRSRIDWKYLLCLELTDPGFDHSVLSEFRDRLLSGSVEELILTRLLAHFRQHGFLKARGQQRTDATHVLGAIRTLNRLEFVGETMRYALNTLAVVAPEWLQAHYLPEWLERYGDRVQEYRLPSSKAKREATAQTIGRDGLSLLEAIDAPEAPDWLREIPALQTLRLAWFQQYSFPEIGVLCWRPDEELPPAHLRLENPYDPEVHYATKRHMHWVGYKVHLTETCDPDQPRLITHVETAPAWRQDNKSLPLIHQELQEKELLPEDHLVDKAYVDAVLLVESKMDFGVNLVGPTRLDTSWQARAKSVFENTCVVE